jgi:hypothetical protein
MSADLEARLLRLEARQDLLGAYTVEAFWHAVDVAYDSTLSARDIRGIVCDYSARRDSSAILRSECIFGGGSLERYTCSKCNAIFAPQEYLAMTDSFVQRDYELLDSKCFEGAYINFVFEAL